MPELRLLTDLVVAIAAAFIGGTIAQRVGLPVIVGYLLAGVALGPFTPGLTVAQGSVPVLAEIGVALLMFALGAEFSQAELRGMGRVAVVGGAVQLLGTMALGPLLAPLLHVPLTAGVFLGALLALSSTVVALKLLMERGELQDLHGRVAVGILVAQDVAVVPMVVLLPALLSGRGAPAASLALTVGEAVVLLLVTYLVGARAAPWLLGHLAVPRSRELFLLGIVTLALGTALVARAIGLSLAFGAFVAGLAIAESEYRAQVVAEVLPLRDLFTSLFFVSVGLLIDPSSLLPRLDLILLLSGAAIAGKVLVVTMVVALLGMPLRVALLSGAAIAQ